MDGYQIKGLEEFDDSPGAAGGRAEVQQPVPEALPNANTVEGVIQGVGIMASGAKRTQSGRYVIYALIALFFAPLVLGLLINLAKLIF